MRAWLAMLSLGIGCGGSPIYAACEEPADCPAPDDATPECIDKASAGFCTWKCTVDDDCAFDEDEYPRVCASFESEPQMYCFPSCEGADEEDPEVCPRGFECRSTGGGSNNRKVCFPGALDNADESPRD